ncbi:MAG: hypothetical protein M3N82_11485 [Pseudomonadota bacterium]|nr:hypothetical protein [Pseudomonadota bacterium]
MAIWEIRPGDAQGRPVLVASDKQDVRDRVFVTDGTARDWAHRPAVEFYTRATKKQRRETANVIPFTAGTFVLDAKARAAIGGFLSRFGQLLELHRSGDGETLYFFNCVNVIDCVDLERSQKSDGGRIILEAIDETKVPSEPTVFKDPRTARVRNYVNDAGKEVIEQWVHEAGITGLEIVTLDPI